MIDDPSLDYKIVFKYLSRNWNLEFSEIEGYKILNDVIHVFNFSEEKVKPIIIEWFSEFKIDDNWWKMRYPPLKTTWTQELVNDLRCYHNIDAEAELTALLSNQLAQEIDRDIINRIMRVPADFNGDAIEPQSSNIDMGFSSRYPMGTVQGIYVNNDNMTPIIPIV